jgi:hypothetical protein
MKLLKNIASGSMAILNIAKLIAVIIPILLLMCQVSAAQTAPAPTITQISPTSILPVGGNVITITGTYFVTGATVTFGSNNATKVVFVNKQTLHATAPASTNLAEGPVNVTVTNPDGQSATLANGLLYTRPAPTITQISPNSILPGGGNIIKITGTGFVTGATVTFGLNSATKVTFVSATTLNATAPASTNKAEGPVDVTVTNPDSKSATLPNGLLYTRPAPTITQISPNSILPGGGNIITITGTGFVLGATVTFGTNSATKVTFVSATSLKATAPASTNLAEGPVDVTVTNPDSQSTTLPNGLLYARPAPTITQISPTAASTNGGTVITITGTGFVTGATVAFGPNNATNVVFVSATTLRATAPASTLVNGEGDVSVFVTNPDTQTATLPEGLVYDDAPSITSISPAQGLPSGGYQVTLTGQYFRCGALCPHGPVVLFGTTPATSVIFNNNTTLTVTVPAHAVGTVSVKETNTDGLSTTLTNGFTFSPVSVTQVTPAIGPITGTNTVTIQGAGFTSGSTVTFGTTAATSVTFISSTTLTAVVPAHAAGPVKVTVTCSNGTGFLTNGYRYSSAPIITSVSPSQGGFAGGTTVTLTGFNMKTVNQVLFGGNAATVVGTGYTFVTVTSPAFSGSANPVAITAIDPNGSGTLAAAFNYTVVIQTQGLDDGYPGIRYSNTLNVSGGTPPYTWSITSGALPSGLSFNTSTGLISGMPAPNYGTYTLGLQVVDSSAPANVATTSLSFNILFGFSTGVIPPTYFGMILYNQADWPTVPIGALGKGLATSWPFLEPSQGQYNWLALDAYVAQAQSHMTPGTNSPVTLYWTNANVPQWAAKDPSTCSVYPGTTPPIYGCTSTVSNIQYFNDFMTALVTRYLGTIQIYELWNEPNVPNVYTGTLADLATLTSSEYNIIRQINPSATILSPSSTAAPYLLSYLTTAGAPLGFDAVAIHGYPNVVMNDMPEALVGFKTVNVKLAMLQAGVGVKPIWDTEGSWGDEGINAINDPDLQVGFVARSLLLHWSVGIQNMYWYGWDAPNWGTLDYPSPGVGITPAATAWGVTFDWMVGASMPTPCSANGGSTYLAVYTCQLTRPGGYTALAVWDTTQTCSNGTCTFSNFTPGTQYVQYRDLTGAVIPITPGQTLQIGAKPILLENMNPPTSGNNLTFSYSGLTPSLATSSAANTSLPPVPASSNLAPTGPPVAGQIPLTNLLVMPGLPAPVIGTEALDSDATLAVGTTQVMQWADFRLQVYGKNTGGTGLNPIGNALQGNFFWSSNTPCSVAVGADGLVQFDKQASAWLVAMRSGANQECIAVSQTPDATQQYNEYVVQYVDAINPTFQMDYPKIGVWPDAYYLTFDMLNPANNFAPQYSVVCALDRNSMLLGSPSAGAVCLPTAYSNNTGYFHLMPSDLDSANPPPPGSPNYIFTFAKPPGSAQYHLYDYQFHTNFSTPSASSLTGPVQIDTNAFASLMPACAAGGNNCVPQPAPAVTTLDSVGGYLMYRAAYRNFGNYESLLLSQAVQTSKTSPVGVRWYEIRNLQFGATIYQDGFLEAADSSATSDSFSRWMSSAAEDNVGNIAMGYSISGPAATSYYSGFPGLAIDGQLASSPTPGSLLTENIVFPGVSVEEPPVPGPKTGRWGAVAAMAIDPVDQCTFYFTGQYQPTAGVYDWATQIVSFQLPGCQ